MTVLLDCVVWFLGFLMVWFISAGGGFARLRCFLEWLVLLNAWWLMVVS